MQVGEHQNQPDDANFRDFLFKVITSRTEPVTAKDSHQKEPFFSVYSATDMSKSAGNDGESREWGDIDTLKDYNFPVWTWERKFFIRISVLKRIFENCHKLIRQ